MITINKKTTEDCLNKTKEFVNSLLAGMTPTQISDSWECRELLEYTRKFVNAAKYKAEMIINKDDAKKKANKMSYSDRVYVELAKSQNFEKEQNIALVSPLEKSFDDALEILEKSNNDYGDSKGVGDDIKKKKTEKKVIKNEATPKEKVDEADEVKKSMGYPKADVVDEKVEAEDKKRKRKPEEKVTPEYGTDMPPKKETDDETETVPAPTNYDNPPVVKKSESDFDREILRKSNHRDALANLGHY